MPDEDELERRLWRTVPWDEKIMQPSEEEDRREYEQERRDDN